MDTSSTHLDAIFRNFLRLDPDSTKRREFVEAELAPSPRLELLKLLELAVDRGDATLVELAVIFTFVLGVTDAEEGVLTRLAVLGWHHSHQDIADLLGDLGSEASVPALEFLATWVPFYLLFDEARALASASIYSLWKIQTPKASAALKRISIAQPGPTGSLAEELLYEPREG